MLKCVMCKELIIPKISFDGDIDWSVCEKCDCFKLTDEQLKLLQITLDKVMASQNIGFRIVIAKPTKPYIPSNTEGFDNDRYQKCDI